MATSDKILYFNFRGRAEPTRMIYAMAGHPLTDERISREEGPKIRKDQPMERLPVFTCSEGTLVYYNTIARYAAKRFGMMGETFWEQTLNDLIMESCVESFGTFASKIFMWKIFKVAKEPENPEKVIEEVYEAVLKTLSYIQKVAEKRGAKFLTCDKLSLADMWLYCSLQNAEIEFPDIMEVNPWVKEFVSKFTSHEKMKKYLSERPVTML